MTAETQTAPVDPFAAADAAKPSSYARRYFGHVAVDAWHVVLVKGTGKVLFDPQQHSADQRRTAISIIVTPLARAGRAEYRIERELVAESAEWVKTIKPSLDKLGVNLKSLHGRYAQVELVELGQYTNKAGETKTRTMPRFLAIYNSQDECQAAADAYYANRGGGEQQAAPAPAAAAVPANDAERAVAAKFLPALMATAKVGPPEGTVQRFLAAIQANSLTAKYFAPHSAEVLQIIAADLPK